MSASAAKVLSPARREAAGERARGPARGASLRSPSTGVAMVDRAAVLRVRPSLIVGRVDDAAERGADRFAAATVRALASPAPAPAVSAGAPADGQGVLARCQNGCGACAGVTSNGETLRRASETGPDRGGMAVPAPLVAAVHAASTGGSPLPPALRTRFEAATGRDLSALRVRSDAAAGATALALNARAYTLGTQIVFAPGAYAADTLDGQRLLAHEIGHVVQAGAAPPLGEAAAMSSGQTIRREADVVGSVVDTALALLPGPLADTLRRIRAEGGILGYLGGVIRAGLRATFGALQNISPTLAEAIATMQGLGTRLGAIMSALASGDCGPLFAAITELKTTVSDAAGSAWAKITEVLTPIGEFFTGIWNRFGAPAVTKLSELAGDAGRWLEKLGHDLWDLTGPVRDAAGFLWTGLKRWIGIGPEDDAAGNEGQGILGWLTARANDAWLAIKEVAAPVTRPIGALVDRVADALPLRAITDLSGTVSDWLSKTAASVDALNEPATTGSAQGQTTLREVLLPALAAVIGSVQGRVGMARDWVASTIGGVAGQLTGLLDAIAGNALFRPLITTLAWLRTAAGRVSSFAITTVGGAFGLIDQGIGLLGSFARRMLDGFLQVVSTVADLPGRFGSLILGPVWRAIPACIRDPVVDFITNRILRQIPVFSQLLDMPDLWSRCLATAMSVIRDIFVDGNFGRGIFRFFSAMLGLIGLPADLVTGIIAKAATALGDILRDPVGFLINLLTALKQGFGGFFGNALPHLLEGVSGWLFGQAERAGLRPPASLSLREVFRFILDALGLGMDFVVARIERISPAAAAMVRKGVAFGGVALQWLSDLMTEGPAALWRHLTDQLSDLWNLAIGAVAGWVTRAVMEKMVPRLLSMLDPTGIGAVVNSAIAIYNAIESAVEYLEPMLRIVKSVLDGVGQIAKGSLSGAAAFVEGALAKAVPIIVGFLANQIGLGSLGKRIGETVEALRERVAGAVDGLLERGRALLIRIAGPAAGPVAGAAPDAPAAAGPHERAVTFLGEQHTIGLHDAGGGVLRLEMASGPFGPIRGKLDMIRARYADPVKGFLARSGHPAAAGDMNRALDRLNSDIDRHEAAMRQARKGPLTPQAMDDILSDIANDLGIFATGIQHAFGPGGGLKVGDVIVERAASQPTGYVVDSVAILQGTAFGLIAIHERKSRFFSYDTYGALWALPGVKAPRVGYVSGAGTGWRSYVGLQNPLVPGQPPSCVGVPGLGSTGPVSGRVRTDRGHLVAEILGGPGTCDNIVAMHNSANQGQMKRWENFTRGVLNQTPAPVLNYRARPIWLTGNPTTSAPGQVEVMVEQVYPVPLGSPAIVLTNAALPMPVDNN